jgi:6-phosphogluconolactonase (cycloisomerase 2 family)
LFAGYAGSSNIGVFKILAGCKLKLVTTQNIPNPAAGLRATPDGKTLVVAYGYGANQVDSLSVASNGKLTEHGPYASTAGAAGVDITKDGKYAIFGDAVGTSTEIEVYPINADGTLGTDNNFGGDGSLGDGKDSSNVWLSPNEKFLFVTNNLSAQITSLGFSEAPLGITYVNITTLKDSSQIISTAEAATSSPAGNGGYLYVSEYSDPTSFVALLQINSDGSTTETAGSPYSISVAEGGGPGLQSLAAYPPRKF